jgi:hypothetical protein
MPDKTDYARKCQQLDVLIDLLEKENKRLNEIIIQCGECTKHVDYRCTEIDRYTGDRESCIGCLGAERRPT